MNEDLLKAILAMDSYNRRYNAGIRDQWKDQWGRHTCVCRTARAFREWSEIVPKPLEKVLILGEYLAGENV